MALDQSARIDIAADEGAAHVAVSGSLTIRTVTRVDERMSAIDMGTRVQVDLAEVAGFDTAGAWSLARLRARAEAEGGRVEILNAPPRVSALLDRVAEALPEPETFPPQRRSLTDRVEGVGRAVAGAAGTLAGLAGYLGIFLAGLARSIRHPREFRFTALVAHCEEVGVKAVPIVALMAFLIGVVLAFQGAVQLRQFGAEVFVVDLIAVSVLRELGVLLTAIIVAGRTASAFTAAIGSMKMREEIDAMRTLGLDPATVLFVPRILALLLMLPILGLIANVAGIFGGALMSWVELGISPAMFRTRLVEGGYSDQLMVGLVKAPVFALIIGVVGCRAGMQVKSNAESLGQQTSKSVVAAIFAVIVADALFSVFFAELGI